MVLELLARILQRHGFWVIRASSAQEAINVLPTCAAVVAFALLDRHLWGTDGLTTMRALRQIKPTLRCCVLGHVVAQEKEQFQAAGAVCILPKPFRLKEIDACLHELGSA